MAEPKPIPAHLTPLHSYFTHSEHEGVCVPPFTNPECYATVEALQSRPDDILIATYSKSGTTWLQNMVYHLMGCPGGPVTQLDQQVPWLQATTPDKAEARDAMPSPRIFKTHDYFSWLPPQWADRKIIYCYRNPKDWIMSYYHHIDSLGQFYLCDTVVRGDFSEYFTKIARDGKVCEMGLWEDHALEWLAQSGAKNILFLTFEDLVEDTERELKRIAEFLGVELTEELKGRVLHEGKFETMQKNAATNYSWIADKSKPFIRKGKVGGWRGSLTDEQSAELDVAIEKVRAAGGKIRCTLD